MVDVLVHIEGRYRYGWGWGTAHGVLDDINGGSVVIAITNDLHSHKHAIRPVVVNRVLELLARCTLDFATAGACHYLLTTVPRSSCYRLPIHCLFDCR